MIEVLYTVLKGDYMMKKKMYVEGMSCDHCVNHVKDALYEVPGVTTAEVDLKSKTALIEAEDRVSDSTLKEAVKDAGYDILKIENI